MKEHMECGSVSDGCSCVASSVRKEVNRALSEADLVNSAQSQTAFSFTAGASRRLNGSN